MKVLKIIGFVLIGVIVLILVISAFLPDHMEFERSIVINTAPDVVYEEVADFSKWEAWSPWVKQDSSIENTFEDSELGPNSVMKWTSTKSGDGLQTITELVANEKIMTKLNFSDWPGDNFTTWKFEKVEGGSKVSWSMSGAPVMYPFRIMLPYWQGMVESSYDMGLAGIKEIAEAKPQIAWEKVVFESPRWAISIRDTVTMAEMENIHGRCYGQIMTYMGENLIEASGKPFCINHDWKPEKDFIDLELAIPVADSVAVGEGMRMCQMPATEAMMYRYFGAYSAAEPTYYKLFDYIKSHNIELSGKTWEVYVSNPQEVTDESKLETDIYFPI